MMRTMTKISVAISAAALAMGGIAYAQMSEGKPGFDADGDGIVTRAEAQAGAKAMFAKLDANKDGKLDQSDREAHHAEMRGKKFEMLDTDKNGSISRQEFMADKGPDRDGMHGPGSMGGPGMGGPEGMGGPGMDKMHGGPDGPGMHGHHGMRGGRHGGMMMMLKKADANNDGAVSEAEFLAAANNRFDKTDANKDGKVTKEERDAAHAKMKAEWKARKAEQPQPAN